MGEGEEGRSYQKLAAWQRGMDLAEACYAVTQSFPREEVFGMTSQIRRAAASIPANIAEGYGREGRAEFIHFLRIAQGSLKELETHLLLAGRVGLMTQEQVTPLLDQTDQTGRILRGLIRSQQTQLREPPMEYDALSPPNSPHLSTSLPLYLTSPPSLLVFGTGVLLRGLVADVAERAGMAITMVSSTPSGDGRARDLMAAGGRFTLRERGLADDGSVVDTERTVGSIQRALSASGEWDAVLATATDPAITVVLSNVSESGFQITEPKAQSFPGRLAAWLRARWEAGLPGVTVLPCELIADNGNKLRQMISLCDPDPALGAWLDSQCVFCETLVDRICTQDEADPLAAIVEPYNFWAIQGKPEGGLGELAAANPGVVIVADDISRYMLRKVRILNGLHTAMASYAPGAFGVATVREALEHPELGPWLVALLEDEILPAICPPLERADAEAFAQRTLLRMRNPFLVHKLSQIAIGAATKWETRLLPTIAEYERRFGQPPVRLMQCRAAFLAG